MTPEDRELLEDAKDYGKWAPYEPLRDAIRAALAEVDRLRGQNVSLVFEASALREQLREAREALAFVRDWLKRDGFDPEGYDGGPDEDFRTEPWNCVTRALSSPPASGAPEVEERRWTRDQVLEAVRRSGVSYGGMAPAKSDRHELAVNYVAQSLDALAAKPGDGR